MYIDKEAENRTVKDGSKTESKSESANACQEVRQTVMGQGDNSMQESILVVQISVVEKKHFETEIINEKYIFNLI